MEYTRPTDSELRKFAAPDALSRLEATQQALEWVGDLGSFSDAHAAAERKVAIALHNNRRPSLYKWAGIVLAFRKAAS